MMKKWKTYALLAVIMVGLMFGVTALQEALKPEAHDAFAARLAKCSEAEKEMRDDVMSANYCLKDADCRAIRLGCHWDVNPCAVVPINKNANTPAVRESSMAFLFCAVNHEAYKTDYEACEKKSEHVKCKSEDSYTPTCVERRCVLKGEE
jgi:hypothetical protein